MKSILQSFTNEDLLKQALRHSSAKGETAPSNERLEFLGDAVLGLVISELLFKQFPDKEEGELTMIKSEVVSRPVLAEIAHAQKIEQLIEIGKGIKEMPESILANALEALLCAIYLEKGLDEVRRLIIKLFSDKIDEVSQHPQELNYKALLQYFSQKEFGALPQYEVTKTSGPAHNPIFEVRVRVGHTTYGPAEGKTKKETEQRVAQIALLQLKSKDSSLTP